MIVRLLGHSQIQTTARYALPDRQSVKTAADKVADSLAEDLGPQLGALPTTVGPEMPNAIQLEAGNYNGRARCLRFSRRRFTPVHKSSLTGSL